MFQAVVYTIGVIVLWFLVSFIIPFAAGLIEPKKDKDASMWSRGLACLMLFTNYIVVIAGNEHLGSALGINTFALIGLLLANMFGICMGVYSAAYLKYGTELPPDTYV